ncbi:MAG: hypothetical protein WKG00_18215 [Polyangiaceae bacterium]
MSMSTEPTRGRGRNKVAPPSLAEPQEARDNQRGGAPPLVFSGEEEAELSDVVAALEAEEALAAELAQDRSAETAAADVAARSRSAEDVAELGKASLRVRTSEKLHEAARRRREIAEAASLAGAKRRAEAEISRCRSGAGAGGYQRIVAPVRDAQRRTSLELFATLRADEDAARVANEEHARLARLAAAHGIEYRDPPAVPRAARQLAATIEQAWTEAGGRRDIAEHLAKLTVAHENQVRARFSAAVAEQEGWILELALTLPLEGHMVAADKLVPPFHWERPHRFTRTRLGLLPLGNGGPRTTAEQEAWLEARATRGDAVQEMAAELRLERAAAQFMADDRRARRWATAEHRAAIETDARTRRESFDAAARRYAQAHPELAIPADLTE